MLTLGALMFGATRFRGGTLFHRKPRIEIAAHRVKQMAQDFVDQKGQPPDAGEWQQILDAQIDDEVLYQYALALGMHENSAAKTRLAQIAEFVEANPDESTSPDERAQIALKLGLHHGDLVVRRILTDSARRLIRSVVLMQKPRQELVEQFFAANAEEYTHPARVRFEHVVMDGFKGPDSEGRARAVLERIRREKLTLEAALALSDESTAPQHLPLTTQRDLEGDFGTDFAATVMKLPKGQWSEPLPSRYGHHLVFVQEHQEATVPPLSEVRELVERQLLERLADDWLKLRLKELRAEYDLVLPGADR